MDIAHPPADRATSGQRCDGRVGQTLILGRSTRRRPPLPRRSSMQGDEWPGPAGGGADPGPYRPIERRPCSPSIWRLRRSLWRRPGRRGACRRSLRRQGAHDLGPIWGLDATVDAFPRLDDVPVGYWPMTVRDDIGVRARPESTSTTTGNPSRLSNMAVGRQDSRRGFQLVVRAEPHELVEDGQTNFRRGLT